MPPTTEEHVDPQASPDTFDLPASREQLAVLVLGNFVSQSVYAVVKLGILDLLASGPLRAGEIAARSGAHAQTLHLMLRALETFGMFAADAEGCWTMTPLAWLLTDDAVQRQIVLMGEEGYHVAADLLQTARAGGSAFERVFGTAFYEYFARNPEAGGRFYELMERSAPIRYADVPLAHDFSTARLLVDVGGGRGALAVVLLKANPQLSAVVYDMPAVVAGATQFLAGEGVLNRCKLVGGDFFASVPAGGDVYLTSSVITNWDDEHAAKILANCRAAMRPDGRLILVETLDAPGDSKSRFKTLLSLASWIVQGSITRTEAQYATLLGRNGFRLRRIQKLAFEPFALIEAAPA